MGTSKVFSWISQGSVFFAGIALGYFAWSRLSLPFSNPLEVVGPPSRNNLNPFNDTLRFAVFTILPSVLWGLLFFPPFSKLKNNILRDGPSGGNPAPAPFQSRKSPLLVLLLVTFAIFISLNIPTYHAFGRFDAFHEGESMGAAMSLKDHQVPYKDFFFFHGVFQDPQRSALAFQLFGKSIGAQRTLESLLKVALWILLAIFLYQLFTQNIFFAFPALISIALLYVPFIFNLFMEPYVNPHDPEHIANVFNRWEPWLTPFHWIIISGRDILTLAFLFFFYRLLHLAKNHSASPKPTLLWFSAFCFTLIPPLALAYSVDRGLYLTVSGFIFFILVFLGFFRKKSSGRFYLGGGVFGLVTGLLVLGSLLQWNYGGFIHFVLGDLPKYKMMTDTLPFPFSEPRYFFVLLLFAFYLFRLTQKSFGFWTNSKTSGAPFLTMFLGEAGVESLLLMNAFFCFRNVLERPVLDHLAYSFLWVYLVVLFDIYKSFPLFWEGRLFRGISKGAIVFGSVLIVLCGFRITRFDLIEKNFPVKRSDDSFLPENRRKVIAYLEKELKKEEFFFAFTNDASWYYLLNRPSPTSYPCLWVAAPKNFQTQVIESLEKKKVRLVLFKNGDWASSIDDIPDVERFPIISKYIQEKFIPYKKIDDQEIWVRDARLFTKNKMKRKHIQQTSEN